ncbi:MAG TPA: DUF945 family protein [Gammaproteobacteria bacterium]|nr:DUF945 family protein [Gammaproteobacteria bacterium]
MGRTASIAAAAAGLIALVLVGGPAASGWYTDGRLQAELDKLSRMSPAWQLEVQRLDRGLFSSRAIVSQRLNAAAGTPRFGLQWQVVLHHGPFPGNLNLVRAVATPKLPGAGSQVADSLFKGEPPIQAIFRIDLAGGRHLGLHSPAIDTPGPAPFAWKGLEAHAELADGGEHVRFRVEMPAVKAGMGPNRLSLLGLSGEGEVRRARPFVWLGHSTASLDSFRIRAMDPDTGIRTDFDIAGLDLETQSALEDGLLASRTEWSVASLFSNDTPYHELHASWRIRRVDPEVIQRLNELALDMEPAQAGADPALRLQGLMAKLPVRRFLAAKPELVLKDLSAGTGDGKLEGRGRLHFKPAPGDGPVNPAALPRFARAELHMDMPEAVFHRIIRLFSRKHAERIITRSARLEREDLDWMADTLAKRRVQELREAGVVSASGGRITSEARWDGRRVTINGHPLSDVPDLSGGMGALSGS